MAKSFADPQWAEFEQLNLKTIVRPRDDFVFRFGQDFEVGFRSKVGEIVYNPADGLVYRNIQETDSVAPDYTNATSNLYWTWIAGSISGFVSGRGWWTKFADGTLIQDRSAVFGSVAITNAIGSLFRSAETSPAAWPIEFDSINTARVSVESTDGNVCWVMCSTTAATVTNPPKFYLVRFDSATATNVKIAIHGFGRWKP